MISIKSEYELSLLKEAGHIVYLTHQYLKPYIKPGITTKELDKLAEDFIRSKDATPSFLNYNGFPGSICTSINNEVVHGIPSKRKLRNGDIISIDIGACYKGYHGDSAWSYGVGTISKEKEYLLKHTEESLYVGLNEILGVVKELVGHGVGSHLHEDPEVPNYGKRNTGPILKEGMVIAVEPMLNLGTAEVFILDDDWTIITGDDKPSAHFEHTVAVTKDGYKILTGDDNCG